MALAIMVIGIFFTPLVFAEDVTYTLVGNNPITGESDSSSNTISFTITRSGIISATTVNYTLDGTATDNTDYNNIVVTGDGITNTGTVINFAANATVATISIDILDDTEEENNETIGMAIFGGTAPNGGVVTHNDNYQITTIFANDIVNDTTIIVGDSGGITKTIIVGGSQVITHPNLIINEVDYDNLSDDEAEFIELKNISGTAINLNEYSIDLYNGKTSTVYKTIYLPDFILNDGYYYVICGHIANVNNCDLDQEKNALIQNGAASGISEPDAVALVRNNVIVDVVSYEGSVTGYVETTGVTDKDTNSKALLSLSRYPDGTDTNDNSADFQLKCITPGTANNMEDGDDCYRLYLSEASVTEGDSGTKTLDITVNLTHAPTSPVTVNYQTEEELYSATAGVDYVAIDLTQLTFPAGDNSPQTISVTINGDEIDEGTSEEFKVRLYEQSNNAQITTVGHEIYAVIIDDESAGFTVNPTNLIISELDIAKTFSIKLNSEPTDNVTISLPSNGFDLLECSIDKTELIFTPSNWNIEQIVTVTAQDDALKDGTQNCDIVLDSSVITNDTNYQNKVPSNITVQVEDDESPGGLITETDGNTQIGEDGLTTDTYSFVLRQPPLDEVTVDLSIDPSTEFQCEFFGAIQSLTFTTGNWDIPQTVTVQAINDETAEAAIHDCIIVHSFSSNDTNYSSPSLPAKNLTVGVVDDDKAEIIVDTTWPEPFEIYESGGTMDFIVRLATEPTNFSDVTVNLSTSSSECSVPSSVTISNFDWLFGKFVTVTAIDDFITDGDKICIVKTANSTSNDPMYAGIDPDDLTLTILDDDIPQVYVSKASTVAVTEGDIFNYELGLYTNPTGNVVISVISTDDSQCIILSPTSITLNDTSNQQVTVMVVDDTESEGEHKCTMNHVITASADSNYPTTMSVISKKLKITDNEPGVIFTQSNASTDVTEGSITDNIAVKLRTQPSNNVTVTITPDSQLDLGEGNGIVKNLSFNDVNWDINQDISITANDDVEVEDEHTGIITYSVSSADTNYNQADGIVKYIVDDVEASNITVNITDNDMDSILPPITDEPIVTEPVSNPLSPTMLVTAKFAGLGSGTVKSSPNGINCQTTDIECKEEFDTASKITFTATADVDSEFDRWSGEDCGEEMFLVNNHICTAYFKLIPRTLNVLYPENGVIISSPNGIDCGNTSQKCSNEFEGGQTIKLVAQPNSEYILDSWSENCPNGIVKLLENTTCTATFKLTPVVLIPDEKPIVSPVPIIPSVNNIVGFSEQAYEIAENAGSINITINRSGIAGEVRVELSSSDDSGKANIHYLPIEQTLFWADDTEIMIPIEIIDNYEVDGDKTVILSLGNVDNAELGIDTSVLTIIDDDRLPIIDIVPIDKTTTPAIPQNNACSSGNVINTTCDFNWNIAKDIIIDENGNVSHLTIKTDIKNYGRIGNSEITEGNQVTGGIFTGYIANHGILADFKFVGASINGSNEKGEIVGMLAGEIANNSEIGGSFENINLAPNVHITGGILAKRIIGNTKKPATLENLHIETNSEISNVILQEDVTYGKDIAFTNVEFRIKKVQQAILSGNIKGASTILENVLIKSSSIISKVIIGDNVKIEEGVTLGDKVTFSIHENYMKIHGIAQLPALGNSIIVDSAGNYIGASFTKFTGGAAENNVTLERKITLNKKSQVQIKSNLLVDVRHIGKSAEILVVAIYTPINNSDEFYMLNDTGKPVIWDGGELSTLIAFQQLNLKPVQQVDIWDDFLDLTGTVKVYIGYRLADGEIVYSPKDVIEIRFTE